MAYKLNIAKQVVKFLDKTDANLRIRIINAFELLTKEPYSVQLDVKPMANKKSHFRLRVGEYRFLYEINKTEVFIYVYKADSRGDVYK
ncbi:MAG: type II toxin-antitoxin system RelE/ParE family toxin [Methylococcaceae bacterium]